VKVAGRHDRAVSSRSVGGQAGLVDWRVMADRPAPTRRPPHDSQAIRRRLQREEILRTAPPVLDAVAAAGLIGGLTGSAGEIDLVIDLQSVERCEPAALHLLIEAAQVLGSEGITLTLSRPSPSVDEALAGRVGTGELAVRRPRTPRPLRHSMRGQI
jgi:hypothetical protein